MEKKFINLLSKEDINDIINENDLNEAMFMAQDKINQTYGNICSLYWSDYDDAEKVWLNSSLGERLNHLIKYLELEDILN